MSILHQIDENQIMNKYYKCDSCGKLLNMGYFQGYYPPKPWASVEEKQGGFYIRKDYCKNCAGKKVKAIL